MRRLLGVVLGTTLVLVPLGACQKDTPDTEMTCEFLEHQKKTGVDVTIPDRCK